MANKEYRAIETRIVFKSTGGDVLFTPTSLAAGAGRISAQYDQGVGAKPMRWLWDLATKWATATVIGEVIELYIVPGDNSNIGGLGTSDAAVSSKDLLRNALFIANHIVDRTTGNSVVQESEGVVVIPWRKFSIVWWNATADALSATASDHEFGLTPIPPELQ